MANGLTLTFGFTGPALTTHAMPVDLFARSVLGLNVMLVAGSRVVFPNYEFEGIELVGTLEGGSFRFSIRPIAEALDSRTARRLATLGGILGIIPIAGSVVDVLRNCPDTPTPDVRIEPRANGMDIVVDGMVIRTNATVVQLLQDKEVRHGLDDFTSPLDREGFEEIFIELPAREPIAVKADRPKFKREYPFLQEAFGGSRETAWLEVVKPAFKKDRHWRVRRKRNGRKFETAAVIADDTFLRRVLDGRKSMSAGDMLHADFVESQYFNRRSGPQPLIIVHKVFEHLGRDEFKSRI